MAFLSKTYNTSTMNPQVTNVAVTLFFKIFSLDSKFMNMRNKKKRWEDDEKADMRNFPRES